MVAKSSEIQDRDDVTVAKFRQEFRFAGNHRAFFSPKIGIGSIDLNRYFLVETLVVTDMDDSSAANR